MSAPEHGDSCRDRGGLILISGNRSNPIRAIRAIRVQEERYALTKYIYVYMFFEHEYHE